MAFVDYYEILELERTASTREIKRSFRKLANQFHPDKNSHDEEAVEKFQKIKEAYTVLADPNKRKNYDLFGEFWKVADELEKGKAKNDISGSFSRRGFFKKFFAP